MMICMIRSSLHCMALGRLDLVMVASRLDTDYIRNVDHLLRVEILLPSEYCIQSYGGSIPALPG